MTSGQMRPSSIMGNRKRLKRTIAGAFEEEDWTEYETNTEDDTVNRSPIMTRQKCSSGIGNTHSGRSYLFDDLKTDEETLSDQETKEALGVDSFSDSDNEPLFTSLLSTGKRQVAIMQ